MKIDETKQKIIENSKQVFIEKGLKDVTMTDLVSVSGYSRGGVYRYFKTPTDIFKELMKQNLFKCCYISICKPFLVLKTSYK